MDPLVWGLKPCGLLLWFGDLKAARAGIAKVLDAHKRMLASVRQGEATADGCAPTLYLAPWLFCCRPTLVRQIRL